MIGEARGRNKKLMQMPTGYLWHAYSQNPNAQSFPWSGCGYNGEVPRWAVLEELQQRSDGRELLYPGTLQEEWGAAAIQNAKNVTSGHLNSIDVAKTVSVVISTSPTPNRASTSIIDACYVAMRRHLPDVQVYILIDGLREEQSEDVLYYNAYKKELRLRAANHSEWDNVTIVESSEFQHEAGKMRNFMASGLCTTPLICYLQHDAILVDSYIDWRGIVASLQDNIVSCVRFALDVGFPQGKEHMYRGSILTKYGVPLLLITELFTTACIARTDFFQHIISQFVTARCHLDGDEIQPVTAYDNGVRWRIGCYCPFENQGQGFLRVSHADARRAGVANPDPKFPTEL